MSSQSNKNGSTLWLFALWSCYTYT